MHTIVLSNAVPAGASPDERDVLVQVDAVRDALQQCGHRIAHWTCSLDLQALAGRLCAERPDVVFNLVEALAGSDRLAPVVTLLLDSLDIPYTGSPTLGLLLASGKLTTKERLREAGLPTPGWAASGVEQGSGDRAFPRRVILKPVWEHASFGMDDTAVVAVTSADELHTHLEEWTRRLGKPCFAEDYIEGREFNLSVLAGTAAPDVLPPAEIDFSAFPAGKPRIVGYRAKWEAGSFEYEQTPRRFEFPAADAALLERLRDLARRAWNAFGLGGYARVDFRVDAAGQPWILEINANPCLSPDAGFAAAVAPAGLTYEEAIERILADALAHERPADASR